MSDSPLLRDTGPDLGAVLDQVVSLLGRYVAFANDHQPVAIALWIAHTHAIAGADVTPYLDIYSPEKRSGKSRLLDVVELLVLNSWRVVTPTEAVTFRKIARDAPTILLDEVDAIFRQGGDHEGLRATLNAGFQRGSRIPRCVGPRHELAEFDTFCCKALAGIGRIPDTVADRSIPIALRRHKRSELVERFRRRDVMPHADTLREHLAEWAALSEATLRDARPAMPEQISDRAEEAWEPLVAIADMAGGSWGSRARIAAVSLSTRFEDDQTTGVHLLTDIRTVLRRLGSPDKVPTAELLTALHGLEEAPWSDWYGKPLTADRLSRLLRNFDCRSKDIWTGHCSKKGYRRADLEDAFARYLGPERIPSRETRETADESQDLTSQSAARNGEDGAPHKERLTRLGSEVSRLSRPEGQASQSDGVAANFLDIVRLCDQHDYPGIRQNNLRVHSGPASWWALLAPISHDGVALQEISQAIHASIGEGEAENAAPSKREDQR